MQVSVRISMRRSVKRWNDFSLSPRYSISRQSLLFFLFSFFFSSFLVEQREFFVNGEKGNPKPKLDGSMEGVN